MKSIDSKSLGGSERNMKQKIVKEIESIKSMIPNIMLDENDSYVLLKKIKEKLNLLLYDINFMEE